MLGLHRPIIRELLTPSLGNYFFNYYHTYQGHCPYIVDIVCLKRLPSCLSIIVFCTIFINAVKKFIFF